MFLLGVYLVGVGLMASLKVVGLAGKKVTVTVTVPTPLGFVKLGYLLTWAGLV